MSRTWPAKFSAAAMASSLLAVLVGCAPLNDGDETPLTLEHGETIVETFLANEAEGLGIANPPEVARVRFVTLTEWAPTQVSCMQEAGFEARLTADGEGVDYSFVPDSLADQLALQIYTCEAQYPPSPIYLQPLTDSQLRVLYAYFVGDLTECLKQEGYSTGEVPSETVFIESDGAWSPYGDLALSLEADELLALTVACPQLPPD